MLESGVGEGIFFAGQNHAAIKIVASYTEDQIVTTNPAQLLEIEKEKKEFEAEMAASEAEGASKPGAGKPGAGKPEEVKTEAEPTAEAKAEGDKLRDSLEG